MKMYRVLCTRWGGVTNTQSSSAPASGVCAQPGCSRDVCDRVTVYERDALPDGPANRAAVPQGRHVHLLMARGAQEFESQFPGLLEDMVADGVPILENRPDCIHFGAAGHVLGTAHRLQNEFTAYVPSRPQLEWQIRRRVQAIDNVDIVNAVVTEPTYDAALGRVTGVLLDSDEVSPPTSSSTRPAGAPGCPHGWRSGDTNVPASRPWMSVSPTSAIGFTSPRVCSRKVVVAGPSRDSRSASARCSTRTATGT